MRAKLWTVANVLMLAMFALSTVVQFNDPDAPVWIAIYAAAATVCALEIRRSTPRWFSVILALIAFIWSAYIGRRVHDVPLSSLVAQWEMKDVRVEEAREMYGLMIVGVWMTAVAGVSWVRRKHRAIDSPGRSSS